VLFASLGVLPTCEVVERTASDFTTGFVGQSSLKTREIFSASLGKVLFIDEAYRLNPSSGGTCTLYTRVWNKVLYVVDMCLGFFLTRTQLRVTDFVFSVRETWNLLQYVSLSS